ncbi:leucine-rich repeat domain-containing protein [Fredinandcohnia sp. 179-A 10B2 NHS]|uniref:leucine-rich repeat domain-containing protein n=1 Tax=Fredinandcohnia sp. 179-A 10B2 NHS TaxID=3235176 RepID=UPI0039A29163
MRHRAWVNITLILVLLVSFCSPYAKTYAASGLQLVEVDEQEDSTILTWDVSSYQGEELTNYQLIKNGKVTNIEPVLVSETDQVKRYSYEDKFVDAGIAYTYQVTATTTTGEQLTSAPIEFVKQPKVESNTSNVVADAVQPPPTEIEVVPAVIQVVTDKGTIPLDFNFYIEGIEEHNSEVIYDGYLDEEGYFTDYYTETSNLELPTGTYRLVTYNYTTEEDIVVEFEVVSGMDYVTNPIEIILDDEKLQLKKVLRVEGASDESISVWWDGPWYTDTVEKYLVYLNGALVEEITDPYETVYTFSGLTPNTLYDIKVEIVYKDGTLENLEIKDTTLLPPTGEIVAFADENLKAAIQSQLKIYHRDIYTDDMERLTSLDAGYTGIVDLAGLEFAVNLEEAMLYGNEIQDLSPLSQLTNLRYLDLDENLISNIDAIVNLQNLEILLISYNQLEDISALLELKGLTQVSLNGNDGLDVTKGSDDIAVIKSLLENGVTVEWGNGINELYVTDITETSVEFELYFPELAEFITAYNIYINGELYDQIPASETYYQVTDLEPLSEIDITVEAVDEQGYVWGSAYTYVTTPPVPEGEFVTFADSALEDAVREALRIYSRDLYESDMSTLISLDATNRGITNLTGLETATNLEDLYLDNNSISDLKPISGLTNLYYLTLGNNEITDISDLKKLTNLQTLVLDRNQVKDISSLANLKYLTTLSIRGNNVTDISVLANLPIEFLDISFNKIEDISSLLVMENLYFVLLMKNNLDLTDGSEDLAVIKELEDRGIYAFFEHIEITVDNVTETSIELSWQPETIDGYSDFLYSVLVNGEELEYDIDGNSYVLSNLEPGAAYSIDIIGYSLEGERIIFGSTKATTASSNEDPDDNEGEGPGENEGEDPGESEGNDPEVDPINDEKTPGKVTPETDSTNKENTTKNNTDGKLPKTSTSNFNLLVIGTSLLVSGIAFLLFIRRKAITN